MDKFERLFNSTGSANIFFGFYGITKMVHVNFRYGFVHFKFSSRILGFLSKMHNRAPPTVIGVMFVWLSFTQSEIECLY